MKRREREGRKKGGEVGEGEGGEEREDKYLMVF